MPASTLPDDDSLYLALVARDGRFDGRFFTGVTSTGIYCRPICRVRAPKRDNCRFFELAAQAEQAGFRPCLRCRPELAPRERHWSTEDASDILVQQAVRLLETPDAINGLAESTSVPGWLSDRLGISDRHLRRIFEQRLGVSPLQFLLTRRLLTAKQLLADTLLPVSEVALLAGFSSLRRFNDAFVSSYGMSPTRLRRAHAAPGTATPTIGATVHLSWRPPYRIDTLLDFLSARALPGLEQVDTERPSLTRSLRVEHHGSPHQGWLQASFAPTREQVVLTVSQGLLGVLPSVIQRTRDALDLDADPQAIDAVLRSDFPAGDGIRVPGCFDGFELAVRAVLGQQISVAAARTLATRLLERLGDPMEMGTGSVTRWFPTPQALAAVEPRVLGELGIVRQRQAALQALARAVLEGHLVLDPSADPPQAIDRLCALPGIGPWTAHYIAMRALRWPDAWPSGDVAIHQALGLKPLGATRARQEADQRSQRWRPWRSYAVVRAWHGAAPPLPTTKASP